MKLKLEWQVRILLTIIILSGILILTREWRHHYGATISIHTENQ